MLQKIIRTKLKKKRSAVTEADGNTEKEAAFEAADIPAPEEPCEKEIADTKADIPAKTDAKRCDGFSHKFLNSLPSMAEV